LTASPMVIPLQSFAPNASLSFSLGKQSFHISFVSLFCQTLLTS
jgi:hypothetical protein